MPKISDYGLIGDCRTAALVSRDGSIDWLCLPHFSAASVFARLLDPDNGGSFSIRPRMPYAVTRRYLEDTAVLETAFETDDGAARLLDCLPLLDGIKSLRPLREILRTIEGLRGTVVFDLAIAPKPLYAKLSPHPQRRGNVGWAYAWRNELLLLRTDIELEASGNDLRGSFVVKQGQRRYASLGYTLNEPAVIAPLGADADERLSETIAWWRAWSSHVQYDGPHREAVVRSAITLKLLTYSLSGAIVAAPTTSLPETIGAGRNWDYRYCWLRDAGLTMQALLGLGIHDDAGAFLAWLLHATRLTQPRLQVMYDIYGRTNLSEVELPDWAGYRNSRPVRIGNGAYKQKQWDIYGEIVLSADTFVDSGGVIDPAEARMLIGLGKTVCRLWRKPDSGIWESRGDLRHHTYSKLMCWVALDRLLKLQERGALRLGRHAKRFEDERAKIAELIENQCFNTELNAYTSEANGTRVDASLLTMPCVGYKPATDPRVASTFTLICQRLGRNGLLLRYEEDSDGLEGKEGVFGICCFWESDQRAQRGELQHSEELFARLLRLGNDVGLFAEEMDQETGEALGNFPQAFTHVGLINAAISIEKAREARQQP